MLTVGSPTLAGYSLALTVINARWVHRRFNSIKYPNRDVIARVLTSLQQVPLRVISRDGLLASLIVLPENDLWWDDLFERLDYSYTWNIATATNIAWVVIAFTFTVIDSFINLGQNINSNGQGVGTLWLWLLPLVVGWMQVPICSHEKLISAMEKANENAYVASPDSDDMPESAIDGAIEPEIKPVLARTISDERAISLWERKQPNYWDEEKTAPIFNYARVWAWVDAAEEIADALEQASIRARRHQPVRPKTRWVEATRRLEIDPANRAGSMGQVQAYCGYSSLEVERQRQMWAPDILTRILMASLCGLVLQWGTTIAAVVILIFTPTVGLGCRSGAYLFYGILSTLVWFMMLTSSMLNHYCSIRGSDYDGFQLPYRRSSIDSISVAATASNFLRRMAVLIASANSAWIMITCIFQFANFFDTCYCNSSVLGLGSRHAYAVISIDYSLINMRAIWIGSLVLGGGCVVAYAMFIFLLVEPPARNSK
jgi:hypothetical protein